MIPNDGTPKTEEKSFLRALAIAALIALPLALLYGAYFYPDRFMKGMISALPWFIGISVLVVVVIQLWDVRKAVLSNKAARAAPSKELDPSSREKYLAGFPELQQPRPRPVALAHPFKVAACAFVFALICAATLADPVYQFVLSNLELKKILNAGTATTGKVIDKNSYQERVSKDGYRTVYRAGVVFHSTDGKKRTASVEVKGDVFNQITEGSEIPLLYPETQPGAAVYGGGDGLQVSAMSQGVVVIFLSIGLVVLAIPIVVFKTSRTHKRLAAEGDVCVGAIQKIQKAIGEQGALHTVLMVGYSHGAEKIVAPFQLPNGARKFEIGETVVVLVDPEKSSKKIIYDPKALPLMGYRVTLG